MKNKIFFQTLLIIMFAGVFGTMCFAADDPPTAAKKIVVKANETYKIGKGDILEIIVWKEPEFSRESVLVRLDGKISFPLLDDIQAAAQTPTQLKNEIENQILLCLKDLTRAEDFDVDYKVAPFKNIVSNPNIVSIYVAVFVIEDLINHKDIIDIYGADDEIYYCINKQVVKHLK